MDEIFSKSKKKLFEHLFCNEGRWQQPNYGSIVIPKASGVRKSFFCVSTPTERRDKSVSSPYVGQAICHRFSLMLSPSPNFLEMA